MRRVVQRRKSRRSGPVSRILFPPQGPACGRWSAQRTLRRAAAIHLGPPLPAGSGALPGADSEPGRLSPPIWACWRWGLPCHGRHRPRGALLPHHFTLTGRRGNVRTCARGNGTSPQTALTFPLSRALTFPRAPGGVFSVALSLGSRPVAVSHHRALPSSDFPPLTRRRELRAPDVGHGGRRHGRREARGGVPRAAARPTPPGGILPRGNAVRRGRALRLYAARQRRVQHLGAAQRWSAAPDRAVSAQSVTHGPARADR